MSEIQLSRHQRFVPERWERSRIKPHPKNPRQITPKAARRLQGKMKEVGLIQPIIVNRRTGHLIGGHQRLAILDRLEGYDKNPTKDFLLDVSVCDLTDQQELEMLVFLNNPSASGIFDVDILADLNLEMGVGFESMGFDQLDVDFLFDGDARFSHLFEDAPEVTETKEKLEAVKAARAEGAVKMEKENDAEFYFVVVCRDDEEREACMRRLGVPKHEQFVSADALLGATDGL